MQDMAHSEPFIHKGPQGRIEPPHTLRGMIADLRIVIDQIDRNFTKAHELLLEIAKTLDESKVCQRELICRRIEGLLADKIREGKISRRWIEESLPLKYKRSYTHKSEVTSLSSLVGRTIPFAAENVSRKMSEQIAKNEVERDKKSISKQHVGKNGIICSSHEPAELTFKLSRKRLLPVINECQSCRIYKEHIDLLFTRLEEDEELIEKYSQSGSEKEIHTFQHVKSNSNNSNSENLITDVEIQIPLLSLKEYLITLGDRSRTAWINLQMEAKTRKIIGVYFGKIEQRCNPRDKTVAAS